MRAVTFLGQESVPGTDVFRHWFDDPGEAVLFNRGERVLISDKRFARHPLFPYTRYKFDVREAILSDYPDNAREYSADGYTGDITIVIPNYKNLEAVREAVQSVRRFYPDLSMIVVDDGSADASTGYIESLNREPNTRALLLDINIGHGAALHKAIQLVETPLFFTMDTDIIVRQGGFLERMETRLREANLYGVGIIYKRDQRSQYLTCVASLYSKACYDELPPFEHHGDPMAKNMAAALAEGYRVECFPIFDYLSHEEAGTRKDYGDRWDLTEDHRILVYGSTYLTAAVCEQLLKEGRYILVGYIPNTTEPTVPGRMPIAFTTEDVPHDIKLSVQYDAPIEIDRPSYNVHTGLLPEWGGSDILFHTLKHGASEQGLTFHQMTGNLDFGPIIAKTTYPVFKRDTMVCLYGRLVVVAPHFVAGAMRLLDHMGHGLAAQCPKLEPRMFYRSKLGEVDRMERARYKETPALLRDRFNMEGGP